MNPTDPATDPARNGITRRNFMKKSALTAGAVMVLSRGTGFAHEPSSCDGTCSYWTFHVSTVYSDNLDGSGQCFQVGFCHCKKNSLHKKRSYKNVSGKGKYLSPQDKAPWNFPHTDIGHPF